MFKKEKTKSFANRTEEREEMLPIEHIFSASSGVRKVEKNDEKTIIFLYGEINASSSEECFNYISEKMDALATKNLDIDIEEVDYVSSAGLRIFQQIADKLKERQITFRVVNLTENVYRMFKMTGYSSMILLVPKIVE